MIRVLVGAVNERLSLPPVKGDVMLERLTVSYREVLRCLPLASIQNRFENRRRASC